MRFYKNRRSDVIFWVDNKETVGEHLFTLFRNVALAG